MYSSLSSLQSPVLINITLHTAGLILISVEMSQLSLSAPLPAQYRALSHDSFSSNCRPPGQDYPYHIVGLVLLTRLGCLQQAKSRQGLDDEIPGDSFRAV